MSGTFHPAIAAADLGDGDKTAAQIGGWCVLIANVGGHYHAVNDRCPHAGSMLSSGRMRRGAIMCPLHGARFDVATGANLGGTYDLLRRFEVRMSNGMIEVAVPDHLPDMADLPIRLG